MRIPLPALIVVGAGLFIGSVANVIIYRDVLGFPVMLTVLVDIFAAGSLLALTAYLAHIEERRDERAEARAEILRASIEWGSEEREATIIDIHVANTGGHDTAVAGVDVLVDDEIVTTLPLARVGGQPRDTMVRSGELANFRVTTTEVLQRGVYVLRLRPILGPRHSATAKLGP